MALKHPRKHLLLLFPSFNEHENNADDDTE